MFIDITHSAFFSPPSGAANYPQVRDFVTDNANMIDPAYLNNIAQLAAKIKQETTVEIAVVTIESLEGESKEMYAVKLFEQAGIGKKDKDNGLLILVAKQEREYRFEVAAKTQDEKIAAANGMDSAISRLLMVSENYPQLKSNENFLALQSQLEGTENRIAVERMRYNEMVRDYNTRLKRMPGSIIAGMYGFEPKLYFEAEKGAEIAPKVNFT